MGVQGVRKKGQPNKHTHQWRGEMAPRSTVLDLASRVGGDHGSWALTDGFTTAVDTARVASTAGGTPRTTAGTRRASDDSIFS